MKRALCILLICVMVLSSALTSHADATVAVYAGIKLFTAICTALGISFFTVAGAKATYDVWAGMLGDAAYLVGQLQAAAMAMYADVTAWHAGTYTGEVSRLGFANVPDDVFHSIATFARENFQDTYMQQATLSWEYGIYDGYRWTPRGQDPYYLGPSAVINGVLYHFSRSYQHNYTYSAGNWYGADRLTWYRDGNPWWGNSFYTVPDTDPQLFLERHSNGNLYLMMAYGRVSTSNPIPYTEVWPSVVNDDLIMATGVAAATYYSVPYVGHDVLANPTWDWKQGEEERVIAFPFTGPDVLESDLEKLIGKTPDEAISADPVLDYNLDLDTGTGNPPTGGVDQGFLSGLLAPIVSLLTSILDLITSIFEMPGDLSLDLSPLKNLGISTRFPFSLPFDVRNAVGQLVAPAEVPRFEVDWKMPGYDGVLTIDFTALEKFALITRWGSTVVFSMGLILITKKVLS